MKFDPFLLNTQPDWFEAWLRSFAQNHSLDLDAHQNADSRRRYKLIREGETLVEIETLPLNQERLYVHMALLGLSGADICAVLLQQASTIYTADLSRWLSMVMSTRLRLLYVEKSLGKPEKQAERQALIAALGASLPPDVDAEAAPPITREAGPTARTLQRFAVFKRIKEANPRWSQARVAREACDELGEIITEDTVKNTYCTMGEKWERGDRIRKR